MSETSTLISCTGKITREELAQVPTPPGILLAYQPQHSFPIFPVANLRRCQQEFRAACNGREPSN